jgi:hypothetical protein
MEIEITISRIWGSYIFRSHLGQTIGLCRLP